MDRRFDDPLVSSREIDIDGFLRLPVRVIGAGRLRYEDGEEEVSLDSIRDEDFLRSIIGKPVIRDEHRWKGPQEMSDVIGNLCGTPEIRDNYVVCEALITDANAIKDIINKKLVETSAGYHAEIGADQVQRNLLCNHLVICEAGKARGGHAMRVANTNDEVAKRVCTQTQSKRAPVKQRMININIKRRRR